MSVIIFTGPTLAPAEARTVLDAQYLPPAAQGDLYRAALQRPVAIGIIDGRFETTPSIWHKEILWAMAQGIHVFGSASMGALRAVELAAFGMVGVGAIYEAYQHGDLEDDDEVAVAHGPAEAAFRPLSVAMVNIRATLRAAVADGVIAPATATALADCAKVRFYPERSYSALLRDGAARGLPPTELAALRAWLPTGQVDQKRADALAMLRLIRERLADGLPPLQVRYRFEHTMSWERVRQSAAREAPPAWDGPPAPDALLEEARLAPELYREAQLEALSRALAGVLAARAGVRADAEGIRQAAESFRAARNLLEPQALSAYLAARDLDGDDFARLVAGDAALLWAKAYAAAELRSHLLDRLRVSDAYPRLRERAAHKRHTLRAAGLESVSLADLGLSREELLDWYFAGRLGAPIPPDLTRYARSLGFADEQLFLQAVLREYCYVTRVEGYRSGAEERGVEQSVRRIVDERAS